MLKPNVLADAEQHVKAANLSRIVLIDNLQKVIEVENPPPEKIIEFQNRKGKWKRKQIFFFFECQVEEQGNLYLWLSLFKHPKSFISLSFVNSLPQKGVSTFIHFLKILQAIIFNFFFVFVFIISPLVC